MQGHKTVFTFDGIISLLFHNCDGGDMRVYCETYGCTANRGDAELMLGQLATAGHEVVTDPAKADASGSDFP